MLCDHRITIAYLLCVEFLMIAHTSPRGLHRQLLNPYHYSGRDAYRAEDVTDLASDSIHAHRLHPRR